MVKSDERDELPGLQAFLKRGSVLGREIVNATTYEADDHFAFMAAAFTSRQVGHCESLLLLEDHVDTQLIARSMVEGMCQLFWAHHDIPARPLRWRLYSIVVDWRLLEQMKRDGKPLPDDRRRVIEAQLKEHGAQFVRRSGIRQRSPAADPYVDDWTGLPLRALFREVEAELLYLKPYRRFAAWHHWSPAGIGHTILRKPGVVTMLSHDTRVAAGATAVAYQCVVESARLLDLHLRLGFESKLRELSEEYVAWNRRHGRGLESTA